MLLTEYFCQFLCIVPYVACLVLNFNSISVKFLFSFMQNNLVHWATVTYLYLSPRSSSREEMPLNDSDQRCRLTFKMSSRCDSQRTRDRLNSGDSFHAFQDGVHKWIKWLPQCINNSPYHKAYRKCVKY